MFNLGKKQNNLAALLIDVGSGNIDISIVQIDKVQKKSTMIWNFSETLPFRQSLQGTTLEKIIISGCMNALMEFESRGMKALRDYSSKARITHTQFCFSAPWSYTLVKSYSKKDDSPFILNDVIVEDLRNTYIEQLTADILPQMNPQYGEIELVYISPLQSTANGYKIDDIQKNEVTEFKQTDMLVCVDSSLLKAVFEMKEKIIPQTVCTTVSQIATLLDAVRQYSPSLATYSVIDVGYETTEIAIVENNILTNVHYAPMGINTLIRTIAKTFDLPHQHVSSMFSDSKIFADFKTKIDSENKLDDIIIAYEQEVASLFSKNTDTLFLPKTVVLYTRQDHFDLVKEITEQLLKRLTGNRHIVLPLGELLGYKEDSKTKIHPAWAYFFHNHDKIHPPIPN